LGYYWPTLFLDVHTYVRSSQACQFFAGRKKLSAAPLKLVVVEAPFQQGGLISSVNSMNSGNGFTWILIAMNYFTWWVKATPMKVVTARVIVKFLEEHIITWFGTPLKLTTDNA
jgi:hypothetical protein